MRGLSISLTLLAVAVTLSTLFFEPLGRLLAFPRSAGATLRAFCMLWKDLPNILRRA